MLIEQYPSNLYSPRRGPANKKWISKCVLLFYRSTPNLKCDCGSRITAGRGLKWLKTRDLGDTSVTLPLCFDDRERYTFCFDRHHGCCVSHISGDNKPDNTKASNMSYDAVNTNYYIINSEYWILSSGQRSRVKAGVIQAIAYR